MMAVFACVVALLINLSGRLPRWLQANQLVLSWASNLEQRFNTPQGRAWRSHGVSAWLLVVLPALGLLALISQIPYVGWLIDVLVLCWALELAALKDRVFAIGGALKLGDVAQAKRWLAPAVAHQVEGLSEQALAKASVESVLKDGVYTVLAVLFWFALFGALGAALYRLSHGLNRVWGHRDPRFIRFGWAAANIFHLLAFVPSRLAALSFVLLGHSRLALRCWRYQARRWPSTNAGAVLAAGAGALNIRLGGPAYYAGWTEPRCELGGEGRAGATSLDQALNLIYLSAIVWLSVMALGMLF